MGHESRDEKASVDNGVVEQQTIERSTTPSTSASDLDTSNTHSPPTPVTPPPSHRTGRWTPDEKILFLYGLRRFGKGRWKKMSIYLPHRSLVQIKSHAQKVLKRLEAGENVFRRLEESCDVIDSLIVQAAKQRGNASDSNAHSTKITSHCTAAKRKRTTKATPTPHKLDTYTQLGPDLCSSSVTVQDEHIQQLDIPKQLQQDDAGKGAVIAAAALCQLSSLGAWKGPSAPTASSLQQVL